MKITTSIYNAIMWCWRMNPFKKQTAKILRSLNIPIGDLYKDFRFEGDFTFRYKNKKLRLHHHASTTIENEIFWKGMGKGWEKVSVDCWTTLCENASVILDIGANTGLYGALAKKFNPSAKVFCFEPAVETFERLKQTVSLNELEISCVPLALSNHNGTAEFFDFNQPHQYSASLSPLFSAGQDDVKKYSVQTKTLSSFINEEKLERIDLMKIDVELHEPEVLEGMGEYLQKFRPIILIEILTDEMGERIESLLPPSEYNFYEIDEVHHPRKSDTIKKSSGYNYIMMPKEKLNQLKRFDLSSK